MEEITEVVANLMRMKVCIIGLVNVLENGSIDKEDLRSRLEMVQKFTAPAYIGIDNLINK